MLNHQYITIIFNAQALNFKLLLAVVAFIYNFFFFFTKPRKKLDVDLTEVNKTEKALLSYSCGFKTNISKVRDHYAMSISLNPCAWRKVNR